MILCRVFGVIFGIFCRDFLLSLHIMFVSVTCLGNITIVVQCS